MADVTGTGGNDLLTLNAVVGNVTTNIMSPYNNFGYGIDDTFRIVSTSYDGLGGIDTFLASNQADFLDINSNPTDPGSPTFASVETFVLGAGNDVINLASAVFTYGPVTIDGGAGDDLVLSNVGDDVLRGLSGLDTLDGGPGNDLLQGGDDADALMGGAGDDTLEGGESIDDYAMYTGVRADYLVEVLSASSVRITDLRDGSPDGVDLVDTVEFFAFADGAIPTEHLLNVPPTLLGNLSSSVVEGQTRTITQKVLPFRDSDDAPADVTFYVSNMVNGEILVDGVPATSFTGQLLNDGRVAFRHDGSETQTASFSVSVEDGDEDASVPQSATFQLQVTPVNDAPIASPDQFQLGVGASSIVIADSALLGNDSDTDNALDELSIAEISEVTGGSASIGDDGSITFIADGSGLDGGFLYRITDGNDVSDWTRVTIEAPPPPPNSGVSADAAYWFHSDIDLDYDLSSHVFTSLDVDHDLIVDVDIEGNLATFAIDLQAYGVSTGTDLSLVAAANDSFSGVTAVGYSGIA